MFLSDIIKSKETTEVPKDSLYESVSSFLYEKTNETTNGEETDSEETNSDETDSETTNDDDDDNETDETTNSGVDDSVTSTVEKASSGILDNENIRIAKLFDNFHIVKNTLESLIIDLSSLKSNEVHYSFVASLEEQCTNLLETVKNILDSGFEKEKYQSYVTSYYALYTSVKLIDKIIFKYANAYEDKKAADSK